MQLQRGHEPAFNALYKAYSKPLYMRTLRLVKNKNVADELLQEVFIRLWNSREQVNPEKSFQSYLFTIAQHIIYNYFRKAASDNRLMETLLLRHPGHYLNIDQLLENKETHQLLYRAIERLTPQRKLVFCLCKLEGKSYEEVSRIMNISVATVNSHMTQALAFLKADLLKNREFLLLLFCIAGIGKP
ncbi:RNA polymerase sigma factor [Filimonas effusa]|uniref:RNA polymerase sigma factor n=1 Tax=Filimonas effusa TaxID=2508721 RepID=UPI001C7008A2|nr:RNA polymerase sigma-70 factor [Filimonas effusa]